MNFYFNHDPSVLAKLREMYGNQANIQPTSLRLEKVITAGDVNKQFTLSAENATTKRPLERYLATNDNFVCTAMSVGLYRELTLTGTAQRSGNSVVYYYPDLNVFPLAATAVNVSEADALEAIYNGTMSIKSDTFEVINQEDLLRYRCVAQTQKTATTQASSGLFYGQERVNFWSPIVFEGKKRNEVDIRIAQGADTVQIAGDVATGQNVYALLLYGWVIRNASEAFTINEAVQNGVLVMG